MKNEKNIQEHSPKMPIIIVETKRKKQLDPPCKSQAIMVQSESSRGNRVPVGFPERKRKKRENKNMNNINTLTKKGNDTMKNALDIFFAAVALLPAALLFIL